MEYAFVGGLSISQALLISPLTTISTRRWGTRTTLFIGVVLETVALIGASFATCIWHLLLSQGVCFGWGMGFLFVGSMGIIPQWFSTRRSLAMGISAAGAGLWGLIYNLVAATAIQTIGLAWTYRVLAAVGFVVNLFCSLLVKDRNKAVQPYQLAFDYKLFARLEFWLILGWGFLSELGYITLLYSLPNYAISIGLTPQQGSVVGALLNLGLCVGRPAVGYFSDALGRINMATIMTGFCGFICLVIWIFAKSYGVLLFFALLAGTVCGTFWSTAAPVGAEVVSLKELNSTLSMLWLVLVIPSTCEHSHLHTYTLIILTIS
jgi:MFS family permease